MGTFRKRLKVANPDNPNLVTEVDAIVDCGATYTWIPEDVLNSIGIAVRFRRQFKIADGSIIERDGGIALIEIDGQTLPSPVVFGDVGSEYLLGSVTLEIFGLGVDTVNQQLVPVTLLLV